VVDYDEADDPRRARAPGPPPLRAGWRAATPRRATKYRHMLDDTLSLDPAELAVLAVLMLRGPPDAPASCAQRTDRLHHFPDHESLEEVLRKTGRGATT